MTHIHGDFKIRPVKTAPTQPAYPPNPPEAPVGPVGEAGMSTLPVERLCWGLLPSMDDRLFDRRHHPSGLPAGMVALIGDSACSAEQFEADWDEHLARTHGYFPVNLESLAWLAREYYRQPGNSLGGHLHVALDDGNVDAATLVWCHGQAVKDGDVAGAALALGLLDLSVVERAHFVQSHHQFYSA